MIGKLTPVAFLFAGSVVAAGPVAAAEFTASGSVRERPTWGQARGVSIGLQSESNWIDTEPAGQDAPPGMILLDETGKGLVLNLGYSFTESFVLKLSIGTARHLTSKDGVEAMCSSAVFETHWRFLPTERARPYLFGGLGGTTIWADAGLADKESNGGVTVVGAGVLYYLTDHLALDFNTRLDRVNWEALDDGVVRALAYPSDGSGGAGKLHLGGVWEF